MEKSSRCALIVHVHLMDSFGMIMMVCELRDVREGMLMLVLTKLSATNEVTPSLAWRGFAFTLCTD